MSLGYIIRQLRKSELARNAFYRQQLILSNLCLGIRYKDMPDKWFDVPYDVNDPISASSVCADYDRLMDAHNFKKAKELGIRMQTEMPGIGEGTKQIVRADFLFLEIVGERRPDEIARLHNIEMINYLNRRPVTLGKLRLQYAHAKIIAKDDAKAADILRKINKVCESYVFVQDVEDMREWVKIIDRIAGAM